MDSKQPLLFIAPPGVGKTMLARRLAKEVKLDPAHQGAIYRAAGRKQPSVGEAPFRAPHHTCSIAALKGRYQNGFDWRPGELSLAHGGTLFLDEAPEFASVTWNVIREAMDHGRVTLTSRWNGQTSTIFAPASFRLILAMNPCSCGWHMSEARACSCTPEQIRKYQDRIPRWLTERCMVLDTNAIRYELRQRGAQYPRASV